MNWKTSKSSCHLAEVFTAPSMYVFISIGNKISLSEEHKLKLHRVGFKRVCIQVFLSVRGHLDIVSTWIQTLVIVI